MKLEELKEKSIEELKAIAYDQMLNIQGLQQSLQIMQSLIAEKNKKDAKTK